MTKKRMSTYDKFVSTLTPQQKKEFDREYDELAISEMLIAAMERDNISIRKLAETAKVSPTIIQEVRSGARKNVSLKSFLKIFKSMGYTLVAEKNGLRLPLDARK
jgi:hypothetical protein